MLRHCAATYCFVTNEFSVRFRIFSILYSKYRFCWRQSCINGVYSVPSIVWTASPTYALSWVHTWVKLSTLSMGPSIVEMNYGCNINIKFLRQDIDIYHIKSTIDVAGMLTIEAPKAVQEPPDFVERRVSINFENFDKMSPPYRPQRRKSRSKAVEFLRRMSHGAGKWHSKIEYTGVDSYVTFVRKNIWKNSRWMSWW